jgi:hypothetical protein
MQYIKLFKPIIILIFFTLLTIQKISAQKNNAKKEKNIAPQVWLQYNPLNLLEPEIPIAFTGLYKKNNRWGFALDAGIFVATQNYNDNMQRYGGIRLKPEVKYYVEHFKKEKIWLYLSLQGMVKITNTKLQEFVTIQDAAGQPLFSQLANYTERKNVLGVGLNIGAEFMVDKAQRFMIDIYGGVGLREKFFKAINLPAGANISYDVTNTRGRIFNITYNGTFPSVALGLKLSYRIK